MWPEGILGTRADLLMDIILIAVVAIPFVLAFSFARVRKQDYKTHKRTQWVLFVTVLAAVILFELNIRLSGSYLEGAPEVAQSQMFKIILASHIFIAVLTFSAWGMMLFISNKKDTGGALPGGFSVSHKKMGKAIFGGSVFTALSGSAIYVMSFVG